MLINISPSAKLITDKKTYSYESITTAINSYSSYSNINVNEYVGIFCENRPEWIFSFFSVWKKGGIPVPIDFLSSKEEVSYIIQDANIKKIFYSRKTEELAKELIKKYKLEGFSVENIEILSRYKEEEEIKKSVDDTAVVLYTS
jgi:long-chain acyl-CoA synthetase